MLSQLYLSFESFKIWPEGAFYPTGRRAFPADDGTGSSDLWLHWHPPHALPFPDGSPDSSFFHNGRQNRLWDAMQFETIEAGSDSLFFRIPPDGSRRRSVAERWR